MKFGDPADFFKLNGAVRVVGLSRVMGRRVQRVHDGPEPGGKFWAVAYAHDLPLWLEGEGIGAPICIFMTWEEFFARHGRCWWRDAQNENSEWRQFHSEKELPEITRTVIDDYDGCSFDIHYSVMIEIYAVRRKRNG